MKWLEITAKVDTESVEPVSEVFRRHVYSGVSIEQEIDPSPEGDGYTVRIDSPVTIKGYVPLDQDADTKVKAIDEALWHLSLLRPIQPLITQVVDEEDWKDAWKQYYHVQRIGKRVVIKPSWREYTPQPGDVVVEMDPGMAFGTGLHPTTQMSLVEIGNHIKPGDLILDVGTGSGVLSIAAARLGARKVLAFDIDSVAVEAARRNVELNGLQDIVTVEMGSLNNPTVEGSGAVSHQPGEYDIVVENIIAKVIIELSSALAAAVRPSGVLIASGIIDERCDPVKDSLTVAGLRILSEVHSGDWVTLVAEKANK